MLTTSMAAARLRVARETIYEWDRKGILRPVLRTDGGMRLFSIKDVERLRRKRMMKRKAPAKMATA